MFLNNVNLKFVKDGKIDFNILTNIFKRSNKVCEVNEEEDKMSIVKRLKSDDDDVVDDVKSKNKVEVESDMENIKDKSKVEVGDGKGEMENGNNKEDEFDDAEDVNVITALDDDYGQADNNIQTSTDLIKTAVNEGFSGLTTMNKIDEEEEYKRLKRMEKLNILNTFEHNINSFASVSLNSISANSFDLIKCLEEHKALANSGLNITPTNSQIVLEIIPPQVNNPPTKTKKTMKNVDDTATRPKRGRPVQNKDNNNNNNNNNDVGDKKNNYNVYIPTFPEYINEQRYCEDLVLFSEHNDRLTHFLINEMITSFHRLGWLINGDKLVMNTGRKVAFGEIVTYDNQAFIRSTTDKDLLFKNTSIWHAMEYECESDKGVESRAVTDLQLLDRVSVVTLNNIKLLTLFTFFISDYTKKREDFACFIINQKTSSIRTVPDVNAETLANEYEKRIKKLEQEVQDRNLAITCLLHSSIPKNLLPSNDSKDWNSPEDFQMHLIDSIKKHAAYLEILNRMN
jgi:hypothetical protein